MLLGYHTTGLLLHDEATAISELAAIGYRSVAIRPRRGSFNPLDANFASQLAAIVQVVQQTEVDVVLDAESAFIHDPRRREEPSLTSRDAQERLDAVRWLQRLVDCAVELGSKTVLVSAGRCALDAEGGEALETLAESLQQVLEYAAKRHVELALRPSRATPIPSVASFERLLQWIAAPTPLKLAADVGEMLSSYELPLVDRLLRNAKSLSCVLLCDVHSGVSGDQRIGAGEVNLGRIVAALREQEFLGHAIVRVQHHEQLGLEAAQEAFAVLGHA